MLRSGQGEHRSRRQPDEPRVTVRKAAGLRGMMFFGGSAERLSASPNDVDS